MRSRQAEIAIVVVLAVLFVVCACVVIGREMRPRTVLQPGWFDADSVRAL